MTRPASMTRHTTILACLMLGALAPLSAQDLTVTKLADIVLIDGNPLEGYWNWLKTKVVIKGGVIVVDKR